VGLVRGGPDRWQQSRQSCFALLNGETLGGIVACGCATREEAEVNRSTLSGIQPVMKSLLLAGGLASSLVVGIVALPVPAVAAEMCQGQAATLVGSPDMSLVGTDGANTSQGKKS